MMTDLLPELMLSSQQQQSSLDKSRVKDSNNNLLTQTMDEIDSWQADLYRDFDSIYTSMRYDNCTRPGQRQPIDQVSVALETEALSRSLADVERTFDNLAWSRQISPTASSTYGKLTAVSATPCTPQHQLFAENRSSNFSGFSTSPLQSIAGTSEQTRADSRNTNQSFQNGPALVEEMTLSDLEDEISSSLIATREARSMYKSQQQRHRRANPVGFDMEAQARGGADAAELNQQAILGRYHQQQSVRIERSDVDKAKSAAR